MDSTLFQSQFLIHVPSIELKKYISRTSFIELRNQRHKFQFNHHFHSYSNNITLISKNIISKNSIYFQF